MNIFDAPIWPDAPRAQIDPFILDIRNEFRLAVHERFGNDAASDAPVVGNKAFLQVFSPARGTFEFSTEQVTYQFSNVSRRVSWGEFKAMDVLNEFLSFLGNQNRRALTRHASHRQASPYPA